jgi:hypothetical protein
MPLLLLFSYDALHFSHTCRSTLHRVILDGRERYSVSCYCKSIKIMSFYMKLKLLNKQGLSSKKEGQN